MLLTEGLGQQQARLLFLAKLNKKPFVYLNIRVVFIRDNNNLFDFFFFFFVFHLAFFHFRSTSRTNKQTNEQKCPINQHNQLDTSFATATPFFARISPIARDQ